MLNLFGVGADTAAVLLVTAGDNPERINGPKERGRCCAGSHRSRPRAVSNTNQFRLNYAGDRHANNAIWRIVITRLGQHEPRTVAYMNRRLAEGKSKRHIIRCLKRYVAREIYRTLPR